MKKRILLYDTTLRDGAQGEGVSFSDSGKMRLVRRLDEFGVDYIEAGYAGSNRREMKFFAAVRRAGKRVQNDPYVRSLLKAETPAVAVVGKTSRLHVREVLRVTPRENRAMISDTIAYLKENGREVFFDAEHFFDGYKESPDFVMRSLEAAVKAGVDSIVLCDTNGGCLPSEIYTITRVAVRALSVPVGIHTHNDAGMAVANALEGVRAGAAQVQGTVNGFGERCGNADLCTIIPNLQLKMGRSCVPPEKLASLRDLSLFADDLVNLSTNKKAPYVGESAFSHKAGQHVNAVRKNPVTFEHIPPKQVGNERRILLSELSGGSSILLKAIEVGTSRFSSCSGSASLSRSAARASPRCRKRP